MADSPMPDSRPRRVGGVILLLMLFAGPVQAQGIDYGSLEALFGEPVTVSATGRPQRASEVPATMEIITAEQIRRSGATDIPGILRMVAGIDTWRPSFNGPEASVRGYNQGLGRRLLVLVNGRQVYVSYFGQVFWDAIPVELDEIRQIEVIKGPQSALYGFNASSGVVNIVTYNPLYDDVNSLRVRVGTQRYRELSGVATLRPSPDLGIRISAGGSAAQDRGIANPRIESTAVDPRRASASLDAQVAVSETVHLGFEGTYVAGETRLLSPAVTPVRADLESASIRASLSATTPIGLITAQAYHNLFHADAELFGYPVGPIDNHTTVVGVQNVFRIGTGDSFRLSAEYRRDQGNTINSGQGTLSYQVLSAGGMWEHAFSDELSLMNAVRFDHLELSREGPIDPRVPLTDRDFDRTLDAFSFNSALIWRPSPLDTLRFTIGRGLQLPSVGDFGAIQLFPEPGSTFPAAFGNPHIEPTEVINYELSYDRRIPSLTATLRASLFYQENRNLISPTGVPLRIGLDPRTGRPFAFGFIDNVGDSRTAGLELGASGRIDPNWSWALNYAWQNIWDDLNQNPGAALFPPPVNFAAGSPRHMANVRIGYADGPWELDLQAHYRSSYSMTDVLRPGSPRQTFGNAVLLVPRIGYRLTETVTAELSAEGLWSRQETTQAELESRVLFSVVGRW